jgi:hypothetical protein
MKLMQFLSSSLLELITQTSTNLPPDARFIEWLDGRAPEAHTAFAARIG